jgi:hypothetical protein
MSEELTELRAELAALREDYTKLRRELRALQHRFGFYPEHADWRQPKYASVEADVVVVRNEADDRFIPIVMRAEEDCAEISLADKKNRTRGIIRVDETGVRFQILNADGKVVASIGQAADGSGQIYAADAEGAPRCGLRIGEDCGIVNVVDARGKALTVLTSGDGGGEIFVASPSQKPAVTIKSTETGGLVTVSEPGGQIMGFLSASSDAGCVSVYGPHGAPAGAILANESGGGIVLHDVDGKSKMTLP